MGAVEANRRWFSPSAQPTVKVHQEAPVVDTSLSGDDRVEAAGLFFVEESEASNQAIHQVSHLPDAA